MNKIIEKLYVSASEDNTFDTKETKLAYDCVYNAIVANASSAAEENNFFTCSQIIHYQLNPRLLKLALKPLLNSLREVISHDRTYIDKF